MRERAAQVLWANWTGTSTVPSRALYPHQWSWDSAFIAIGLRHLSPLRAQLELEMLLSAQWGDGRVPHIVFDDAVPLDAYFPSPDFWRSTTAGRAAGAPGDVQTSGIVQPPVHALAAWLVHRADPGLSGARSFLARVRPRLAAWHRYLLRARNAGGAGLAAVVHPWEQGMDNSPCWDAPLGRVRPAEPGAFRRTDLEHGAPEDRPTDLDYGRYVRLAQQYRDRGYADATGPGDFAVEDPAFNALLILSEHALALIEGELADTADAPAPMARASWARRDRAEALTRTLVERLWDPDRGIFLCRDLRADGHDPRADGRDPSADSRDPRAGGRDPSTDGRDPRADGRDPSADSRDPRAGGRDPWARRDDPRVAPGPGALIPERGVTGLVPLALPALPRDIAAALVRTACGPHFGLGGPALLVPSHDLTGPAFDPHRYWRGPAWFNTNWLMEKGLRLHGEPARADGLRETLLDVAGASGFAEYVDPYTGRGCGARGFGWTAALTLDLLLDGRAGTRGRGERDRLSEGEVWA
nr:hypothetical protein [Streptomyces luteocolor]